MPELPDVTIYIERMRAMLAGHTLGEVRLFSPFVLRSVQPPIAELSGKRMIGARRIGKRVVMELEDELFVVI
ncbi:MAG: DNA-formamidopyrimidine glycosylase family protein, partial [Myxococcota bacterium]